ncbi:conjugal transfer protein TraG N-terminal domain-containing protein [Carnimonas bestiolae]|uniref:conjugal transfer protein TraG N-terminal domain-containing protein n=1 Tax=Carnimonas bestiolae TaxID=3402172 RepID=UPI003EDC9FF9
MNADLNVNDYLEQVVLMIGWVVNNAIWDVLNTTGMAIIPFVALLLGEWFKVRQDGFDEGNKGALWINRVETKALGMVVCYGFTCAPIMGLSFQPVDVHQRQDGGGQSCSVNVIGGGNWGSNTNNAIDGQTANIPVWWAFVHAVSKGITNASVAAIPCQPDLTAIATEIDTQSIKDPALAREVGQFQRQCYGPARDKLFREGKIDAKDAADTDWLGSRFFQNTNGYYNSLYASNPVPGFPYEASRDEARPNTGPGQPGYPSCSQWWSGGENSLYSRLHDQIDTNVWDSLSAASSFFSGGMQTAQDAAIRRLVSPKSGAANGNQRGIVSGYGSNTSEDGTYDTMDMAVGEVASSVAGFAGSVVGGLTGKAGMDMLRQSLPMVQYILIMAIVICLPFVVVVSGYSFRVVGTATFGLFGLWYLTFWWEMARWLNNNLVELLYGSEGASISWLSMGTSAYDQGVLLFVQWATYLLFPGIWMGTLAWAGHSVGNQLAGAINNGGKGAQRAGDKGTSMASKAATKGIK